MHDRYSGGLFFIRRLGRFLLWDKPVPYRWIGIIRHQRDCLDTDFDVWLGGYPRSANTFALAAFRLTNPNARVASHCHIPTYILNSVWSDKPGILLLRNPLDAVISWSIYWQGQFPLGHALDYYIDFHRALLPSLQALFVATFEDVTTDFSKVMRSFNRRFRTSYTSSPHDAAMMGKCFSVIEKANSANGSLNELIICRPSAHRAKMKPRFVRELYNSPKLLRKLEVANQLHSAFRQGPSHTQPSGAPRGELSECPERAGAGKAV